MTAADDRFRAFVAEARGVVGVLRAADLDRALSLASAALKAGLRWVEITWTTPGAARVVSHLRSRHPDATVGADTILTRDQAEDALDAGAQFLVGPNLSSDVLDAARDAGTMYVPGVATPTEAVRALESGARMVKLFPIRELGGPAYLRALRGPLPELPAMVTGGVAVTQVRDYLKAGALLVGAGSVFAESAEETRERVRRLMTELAAHGAP